VQRAGNARTLERLGRAVPAKQKKWAARGGDGGRAEPRSGAAEGEGLRPGRRPRRAAAPASDSCGRRGGGDGAGRLGSAAPGAPASASWPGAAGPAGRSAWGLRRSG
jgi:hypothetical protein